MFSSYFLFAAEEQSRHNFRLVQVQQIFAFVYVSKHAHTLSSHRLNDCQRPGSVCDQHSWMNNALNVSDSSIWPKLFTQL